MGKEGELLAHSPLGASGAYRWMICPGSVGLSKGVPDEESDDAALGTAAHALAEHCLTNKVEPWSLIGQYTKGDTIAAASEEKEDSGWFDDWIPIDKDMADAVEVYVSIIALRYPNRNQGNSWVERKFHSPAIHQYFYGTGDFVYLITPGEEFFDYETGEMQVADCYIVDIIDYKHGVGIVVEADDNPQLKYYAAGVIEELALWDDVGRVRLHIVQPRGWHWKGPHRVWEIDPDDLDAWVFDECVPAMDHALVSRDTKTGEHCRFCPARQTQCPALMADMEEYEELLAMLESDTEEEAIERAKNLTPEQLGRLLELESLAKIPIKAAKRIAHGLLSNGHSVPGTKIVAARTNRAYKDPKKAQAAAVKQFKKEALTKPELKSPAQIDELPGGKAFTARWAFKPEGGTTIALEKDMRRAIKRDAKSLFKPVK